MSYIIKESQPSDVDLINNFNKELEDNKIIFRLPNPNTKTLKENSLINARNFILTEDQVSVRAGYSLKSQLFKVNKDLMKIGFYYNPVTAGIYNKKHNICGLLLLIDAQKKYSNLFM